MRSDDGQLALSRRMSQLRSEEIELRAENRSFQERVRLFSAAELEALLHDAGLAVVERFGDYDGRPFAVDTPRAILIAVRP